MDLVEISSLLADRQRCSASIAQGVSIVDINQRLSTLPEYRCSDCSTGKKGECRPQPTPRVRLS